MPGANDASGCHNRRWLEKDNWWLHPCVMPSRATGAKDNLLVRASFPMVHERWPQLLPQQYRGLPLPMRSASGLYCVLGARQRAPGGAPGRAPRVHRGCEA